MYLIFKAKGSGANVSVDNTDTNASVVIGKLSTEIINTMKEGGVTVPDYKDEWSIEVNKECAKALVNLTMKMRKPIRDQRKKTPVVDNSQIDAMDVLLGLAKYN